MNPAGRRGRRKSTHSPLEGDGRSLVLAEPRAPLGGQRHLWLGSGEPLQAKKPSISKIRRFGWGPEASSPKQGWAAVSKHRGGGESARVCVREEREGAMRRLQLTRTGVRFAEPQSKEPVQGTGRRVGFWTRVSFFTLNGYS